MHQLTGLDAAFLAIDSPTTYGHVGSVVVVEPAGEPLTLDRVTALIGSRLHLVPPFRRRLVEVPLGIDQPYWIEDPDFDLEYHVREIALPPPGDDRQLAEQVSRLHARPLDRSRPLWESYLVHGLAGGRQALYSKVHHAAIDGVAGTELLTILLDPSPEGRDLPPAPPRTEEPVPGGLGLLVRGLGNLAFQPIRAARVAASLIGGLPAIVRTLGVVGPMNPLADGALQRDDTVVLGRPALRAPATPFNRTITPHRRWGFRTVSLDDVKQVRVAHDVTVNDVVMAMSAGALRRWLLDHDALPDAPLVAAVPISVRTEDGKGAFGNQVSVLVAALPTHLADPLDRLRASHQAMGAAKDQHAAVPAGLLTDVAQFSMPALAAQAARLSARLRIMERVSPANLFVSNVPGPRVPLYFAGSKLLATYPMSAIFDGQGLNITVNGYGGGLHFGLLACRELVPDVDDLAGHLVTELAALTAVS